MTLIDTILAIFTSGGITVVTVVAACKWITKQVLEGAITTHNEKILAKFNSLLERQGKIVDFNLNYKSHILEHQYDAEFANYLEIWGALQRYTDATLKLRNLKDAPASDFEKQQQENEERSKKWEECRNEFKILVDGKAPFYQKVHYELFIKLNDICIQLYDYYKGKKFNVQINESIAQQYIVSIKELQNEILDELRNYLQSLKVIGVEENNGGKLVQ